MTDNLGSIQKYLFLTSITCGLSKSFCNYRRYLSMAKASLILAIFLLCTISCRATECLKECGISQTCCPSSVTGDFTCCPHSNAVCCADGEHCCPENTLCDSSSGGCVSQPTNTQEFHDRKGFQNMMDKTPSIIGALLEEESQPLVCPDFTVCPGFSTCCSRQDSTYGCCPYVNGVCCDDYEHCCPKTFNCDKNYEFCLNKYSYLSENLWNALALE